MDIVTRDQTIIALLKHLNEIWDEIKSMRLAYGAAYGNEAEQLRLYNRLQQLNADFSISWQELDRLGHCPVVADEGGFR